MFNSLLRVGFYFMHLGVLGAFMVSAQGQRAGDTLVYENRNQIDPKPLKMHAVHGVAKADDGSAISAMKVGIFTESNHVLVATTKTDQNGLFSFSHIAVGRYRLVAEHPAFCTANV